jgi:hypothetical protein
VTPEHARQLAAQNHIQGYVAGAYIDSQCTAGDSWYVGVQADGLLLITDNPNDMRVAHWMAEVKALPGPDGIVRPQRDATEYVLSQKGDE